MSKVNKVSFSKLNAKMDNEVSEITFNEQKIEVKKYLSQAEKYNLVMIALQQSKEKELYNPIKIDMYFHLYLVYLYTNINFTEKQLEDEAKLYDLIKSSGLLKAVLEVIDEDEYNDLSTYLDDTLYTLNKKESSFEAAALRLIEAFVPNMDSIMEIVNNFDPDKFEAVKKFAEAANAGREIPKDYEPKN